VGPGILTRYLDTGNYPLFTIFASHYFLPIHFTGDKYTAHKKVYAYQEWGTAKQSYDTMNSVQLPTELLPPQQWVSILIPSYNTKQSFIHDCLESVRMQNGYLGIELVWINDGSNEEYTLLLENELTKFQNTTRFCKVVYERIEKNVGISESLLRGILKCSHELIYRMDSDDVMLPNRLWKQYEFMNDNPDAVICGGGMVLFDGNNNIIGHKTHPTITLESFKQNENKPHWVANHPTLIMRKSAVIQVGNYTYDYPGMEDYDLELKLLKRFGKIHNIPDNLIYYRIHAEQQTNKMEADSSTCVRMREQILNRILDNND
jgi:glycosyltransferase involved in cell wall biosynthesis